MYILRNACVGKICISNPLSSENSLDENSLKNSLDVLPLLKICGFLFFRVFLSIAPWEIIYSDVRVKIGFIDNGQQVVLQGFQLTLNLVNNLTFIPPNLNY